MLRPAFTHPFRALSLSFKHAPLVLREQFALDEDACRQLLHTLRHELDLSDLLVLSTCQRTEVYYASAHDRSPEIIEALGCLKNCVVDPDTRSHFDVLPEAEAAARHLFSVALGLDTRVLGDLQVIGQVKQAYRWAVAAAAAGPFLHRLLHAVFAAHKRVQNETIFRIGATSAGYAAVELVLELTAQMLRPRVLVVGAGTVGADVCRHLASSPAFGEVAVCNRTRHKAARLAAEYGLRLVEFEHLPAALRKTDVVVSAITSSQGFFTRHLVAAAGPSGKIFVDLSMPRSVSAEVAQLPGVTLYNIDAIENKASAALQQRVAVVPQVLAIIEESLTELQAWSQVMQVSPLIKHLKDSLESLRQQELHRYSKRLTPTETTLLAAITRSLMQKVLKQQVLRLKLACQRDNARLLTSLNELFALEKATVD